MTKAWIIFAVACETLVNKCLIVLFLYLSIFIVRNTFLTSETFFEVNIKHLHLQNTSVYSKNTESESKEPCCVSRRCKTSRRSCDNLPCALSGKKQSGAASSSPWLQLPPHSPEAGGASPPEQPSPRTQTSTRSREPDPEKGKPLSSSGSYCQHWKRSTHLVFHTVFWWKFCWCAFARCAADLHQQHEGEGSHEKQLHLRTRHLYLRSLTSKLQTCLFNTSDVGKRCGLIRWLLHLKSFSCSDNRRMPLVDENGRCGGGSFDWIHLVLGDKNVQKCIKIIICLLLNLQQQIYIMNWKIKVVSNERNTYSNVNLLNILLKRLLFTSCHRYFDKNKVNVQYFHSVVK